MKPHMIVIGCIALAAMAMAQVVFWCGPQRISAPSQITTETK